MLHSYQDDNPRRRVAAIAGNPTFLLRDSVLEAQALEAHCCSHFR